MQSIASLHFLCTFAAVMKPQKLFYILLAIWMLVDLLQAIFTPVHADEAYYALYGRFLDWGYYDHPPMVALFTALSGALFKGNLSIRFATVLLHGGTVWLVWKTLSLKTLNNKDVWAFFSIAASLVMFLVCGFITTPDAPLLFFTALFFYLYRRYLDTPNWSLAFAIGVTLAAMLYSKYMAILVVGFVLLSNLKLLKDPKLWVAVLLAASLFVPHLLWQVRNGFPSFQYHLLDRNTGFRWLYFLEYIPNQLLIFNPVCFCLALYFCWKKRKTSDLFERACLFTIAGFILFFWVMTVKGHAEPHWTVAASIPMIILLWYELRKDQWHKWLVRGVVPIVIVLAVLRIAAPPILSAPLVNVLKKPHKYNIIQECCGQTPVVFVNSFQDPSVYSYYTGEKAVLLSSLYSRQTQYDVWQFDKDIQGKSVYVVDTKVYKNRQKESFDLVKKDGFAFYLRKTDAFQGTNRIRVNVNHYHIDGDSLNLDLTLSNPYDVPFAFNNSEFPISLHAVYLQEDGHFYPITCPIPSDMVIAAGGSLRFSTIVKYIPDQPLVLCLDNVICRSVNSKPIIIRNEDD